MQLRLWKRNKTGSTLSFFVKCGTALSLMLVSVFVVACGAGSGANATDLGSSQSTIKIQMNANSSSPTPSLPGEWCGAWVTNPTPSYMAATIGVYAKFTKNVNGNPAGIGGAKATAHVMWSPTDSDTYTATTTSDGLAVFAVSLANKSYAINTITLVTVTFQQAGMPDCTVGQDRAAFFTLVRPSSTVTVQKTPGVRKGSTPTNTPPSPPTPPTHAPPPTPPTSPTPPTPPTISITPIVTPGSPGGH